MKSGSHSVYTQSNSASGCSSAFGAQNKYAGIIKRSFTKQLSIDLGNLMTYVYSISPNFTYVNIIISVIRLFQLIGPSFNSGSKLLWGTTEKSNSSFYAISVISIFSQILPPSVRKNGGMIFLIFYILIFFFFLLILCISSNVYRKKSSLPRFVSYFITFFFASIGYILYPPAFSISAELISILIFESNTVKYLKYEIITETVTFFFVLLLSLIYFDILLNISMNTLTFRQCSFLAITPFSQKFILYQVIANSVIQSISSHSTNKTFSIIATAISAFIYLFSIYSNTLYGGFVKEIESVGIMATEFLGFIVCIVVIVYISISKMIEPFVLFSVFLVWIVSFISFFVLIKKRKNRDVLLLDQIEDGYNLMMSSNNNNNSTSGSLNLSNNTSENNSISNNIENHQMTFFDNIIHSSINTYINIAVSGFACGHPMVVNANYFKLGIEKFTNNHLFWFVFAKFMAIYPEETMTLNWIEHTIKINKVKGFTIPIIRSQTNFISRQREVNLSQDLKAYLNNINKGIGDSKSKLRHVWEMVVQANTNELDKATLRCFDSIDKCHMNLNHLYRMYPNNRFVTRQFARFAREILADQITFEKFLEKSNMLQRGLTINEDQAHLLGMMSFPNAAEYTSNISSASLNASSKLSRSCSNSNASNSFDNLVLMSNDATNNINGNLNENQELIDKMNEERTETIRKMIEKVQIPAITGSIIIRIFMYLILFLLPVVVYESASHGQAMKVKEPLQTLYDISFLRSLSYMIGTYSIHYLYEIYGDFNPLIQNSEILGRNDGDKILENLGGSTQTRDVLIHILNKANRIIIDLIKFRGFIDEDENIQRAQHILFQRYSDYIYMVDNNILNGSVEKASIQMAVNDLILRAAEFVKIEKEDFSQLSINIPNTAAIMNAAANTQTIENVLGEALSLISKYITNQYHNSINISLWVIVVLIVFIYVITLKFTQEVMFWLHDSKNEVYKCLMSLPKNIISIISDNFRVISGKDDNSNSLSFINNNNMSTASMSNINMNNGSLMNVNSSSYDYALNKQEENAMKVLIGNDAGGSSEMIGSGGGSDGYSSNDRKTTIFFYIMFFFTLVFEFISLILLTFNYQDQFHRIYKLSPHLDYIHGSFAMMTASFYSLFSLIATESEKAPLHLNHSDLIDAVKNRLYKANEFYQFARYGNKEVIPFPEISQEDNFLNYSFCNKNNENNNHSLNYINDFLLLVSCYPTDMLMNMIESMIEIKIRQSEMLIQANPSIDKVMNYSDNEAYYDNLWNLLNFRIYNDFIQPMFDQIIPTINNELEEVYNKYIPVVIILTFMGIFPEIFVILKILSMQKHIKRLLFLLMFIPNNSNDVILSNKRILAVLGGDFSGKKMKDIAKKNNEFYKKIVDNMNDAVMIVSTVNYEIVYTNSKVEKLFGVNPIYKYFPKLLRKLRVGDERSQIQKFTKYNKKNAKKKNYLKKINQNNKGKDDKKNKSEKNKRIIIVKQRIYGQRIIVLCKDITNKAQLEKRIEIENEMSHKLLSSILPMNMVKRYQTNSKDISFIVRSATITFLNVVNFSMFYNSNISDAKVVLKFLNDLYGKFDELIYRSRTLTKIKSIGDSFMVAGGIFSELNQPSEHAKESVKFGLDAIDVCNFLSRHLNNPNHKEEIDPDLIDLNVVYENENNNSYSDSNNNNIDNYNCDKNINDNPLKTNFELSSDNDNYVESNIKNPLDTKFELSSDNENVGNNTSQRIKTNYEINNNINKIDVINEIDGNIACNDYIMCEKVDLHLRVGVNIGGPVYAGVLNVAKPTFEIFGSVINISQQMEESGVPDKVHITRAVYELIYGDMFSIKERGNVNIKSGSIVSYLVDKKEK